MWLSHGVASFISLAALSSCFAFEIAASLIPLLRLFPTKLRFAGTTAADFISFKAQMTYYYGFFAAF